MDANPSWSTKLEKQPAGDPKLVVVKGRPERVSLTKIFPRMTLYAERDFVSMMEDVTVGAVNSAINGLLAYAYRELDRQGKTLMAKGDERFLIDRADDLRLICRDQNENRNPKGVVASLGGRELRQKDDSPAAKAERDLVAKQRDKYKKVILYIYHEDLDLLKATSVGSAVYIRLLIAVEWAMDDIKRKKKRLVLEHTPDDLA